MSNTGKFGSPALNCKMGYLKRRNRLMHCITAREGAFFLRQNRTLATPAHQVPVTSSCDFGTRSIRSASERADARVHRHWPVCPRNTRCRWAAIGPSRSPRSSFNAAVTVVGDEGRSGARGVNRARQARLSASSATADQTSSNDVTNFHRCHIELPVLASAAASALNFGALADRCAI